ncbi:hypothetical protein [Paenibacillus sp. FSL M7-0420]|uniref:hypothetical protein n=1 Tax=Paenibacillus sp. FSL M7-0420 TaxID=2921609 RepID=UPI0030F4CEF9
MDINNLVEGIEATRENVKKEENNADIFSWLSDCQVFLESFHPKLEYTKQFITEKEDFKRLIISFQSYSLDSFDSLAATIKSVKKIEETKQQNAKKQADLFRDLNSR